MVKVDLRKREQGKISFVIFNHSGVVGGGEKSNLLLLKNLDRSKFDPIVIFPKGPYEEFVRETKTKYDVLNIYLLRFRTLPLYIFSLIKLFLKLRRSNPRFIYCNSIQSSHWGAPLGFLLGKPVIVHFRDWNVGLGSRFILRLFPSYFAIANSKAVRRKMLEENYMGENKSLTVYNAVDASEFCPGEKYNSFRKKYKFSRNDFLIGIIGRIDVWKGHLDLIEAAGLLKSVVENIRVVVVGDDSWTKDARFITKLKDKIKKLGLQDKVTFTGFQKDIPMVLRSLDLVVIPSRNEPFGRLIIESIAVGTPVIGARTGGMPEIIGERKLGFLFKSGDSRDLARVMREVYEKRYMLKSFIKAEAEKVKKDFLPTTYSSKIQIIFEKVLDHENN